MLKLLLRYWDPQRGQVTLSGTPLPEVDVHARRRIQAMMSQETHLFDGSIRDNLLIALPESEVEAANVAGNGEVGAKTVDSRQQQLAAQSAEAMPFRWQHLTVSTLVCVRLSPRPPCLISLIPCPMALILR